MSVGSNASCVSAVGALPSASVVVIGARQGSRLPLVDAVRALAATVIVGHHFSSYQPLADAASPIAGPLIDWLREYGRVAQVFIVLSGFMLAGSLARRRWDGGGVRRFIVQRYCRLALPYFAAIGFAIVAEEFGRDWIDNDVVGALPTIQQVLAHCLFLQDLLGYESLSAGLWFVCITFQLTLLYVAALFIRDTMTNRAPTWARGAMNRLPLALGWLLAIASLFYFNRDSSWESWAAFFFGQFFLGVLVQRALENRLAEKSLAIYVLIVLIAIAIEWRSRLVLALATGIVLFVGGKFGALSRWPTNRVVAFMGRTSYSLFLIHFPVLVVVATLWEREEWTTPLGAVAGLVFAYVVSILAATLFYRFVEEPAMRLSRRFASA
jgi:peptidoglycan/LPS O-acetylase OafA/YrhL